MPRGGGLEGFRFILKTILPHPPTPLLKTKLSFKTPPHTTISLEFFKASSPHSYTPPPTHTHHTHPKQNLICIEVNE